MYLLLCIIAAISTAIANPVPADEAHREKPLVFSLGKDNTPSAVYRESAYHDQTVPDTGSYGTISDKYRIPNGITSEYPVGDLHIPLQASKSLGPTTVNVLQEPSLHTPKEAPMHQESWYPWRKTDDGTQQDSKCGESKSVCCMKSLTWDTSVVKTCRHAKPGRVFQWESPCQDPQYFDSCDELWRVIDDRNTPMDDTSDRRKVILKDGRPMFTARKLKSKGITCYSDCKRRNNPPTRGI